MSQSISRCRESVTILPIASISSLYNPEADLWVSEPPRFGEPLLLSLHLWTSVHLGTPKVLNSDTNLVATDQTLLNAFWLRNLVLSRWQTV